MKKLMNRGFCLLLAVIMLIGLMPMAMAAERISVQETAEVAVDQTVTLTVENEKGYKLTWSSADQSIATVDQNGTVTGVKAGEVEITVSAMTGLVKDTCTVTVVDNSVAEILITGEPEGAMKVGDTKQLAIKVAPENASKEVIWESSKPEVASISESGLVTALTKGETTITATSKEDSTKTDSVKITVVAVSDAYTIELDTDHVDLILDAGEASSHQFVATVKKNGEKVDEPTIKWEIVEESTAITLVDGLVTAKKSTEGAKLTVKATFVDPANDKAKFPAMATVTVAENDAFIKQDNVATTKSSLTLEPKLTDKDGVELEPKTGTKVKYTYELNGKSNDATITLAEAGGTAGGGYGEHEVMIRAEATLKDNTKVVATKLVYVAFTCEADYDVILLGSVTKFNFAEEDIFSSVKINGAAAATIYKTFSMWELLADGTTKTDVKEFDFDGSDSEVAVLTGVVGNKEMTNKIEGAHINNIADVKLTMKTTGKYTFLYKVRSKNGLILATGSVEVTGNGQGKVTYEGTYDKDITFKYADFEQSWQDAGLTGSPTYVEFGVKTSGSDLVPEKGKLYTTSAKSTLVKDTDKFAKSANTTKSYLKLDGVTYKPDATLKTAYKLEIPFVAYGGTDNKTEMAGIVVIELNHASTDVDSLGRFFGDADGLAGLIAKDYDDNKGKDLGFVEFVLPKVEDGRLLYTEEDAFVRDMTRVDTKTSYWYAVDTDADTDNTTEKEINALIKDKKAVLNRVFFVPAAGKSGKVTLEYVAYDADGNNAYAGKLILNVSTKTASVKFKDVTKTSYSWAADAVDFLYYEGIVNGDDKGNYNPKNSITRGDFMLMLYRAFLSDLDIKVTDNFSDVKEGTSAYSKETYRAIGVAKVLGIAKGDGTNYRPKDKITREEAMTLIQRTLDLENVGIKLEYESGKDATKFNDYKKVSTYAQEPIKLLVAHGIVAGDDKGNLNPKANITRAEMAVILHRVLTY